MAYKSTHKGSQIDTAVSATLYNKSKGSNSNPVYLDEYGRANSITTDSSVTENSENLLQSGGAYTGLAAVLSNNEIQTSTSLGTSGLPASQRAVKMYTDAQVATRQPKLISSETINVALDGEVSVTENVIRNTSTKPELKVDHFGEFSVGNDTGLLSGLSSAAHSTFDKSKFIKEGSPIVTSDGIASDFSDSNYLSTTLDFSSVNDWELNINFTTGSDITTIQRVLDRHTGATENLIIVNVLTSKCGVSLNVAGTQIFSVDSEFFNILSNTNYVIRIGYFNGRYYAEYTTGGDEYIAIGGLVSDVKWSASDIHYLGRGGATNQPFLGKINLMQFYCEGDGKTLNSGNKTGIDTVKPDNFTDSGSLVNAEGIAVFPTTHDTSCIVLPEQFKPADKPWEIYIHCKTGDSWNTAPYLFSATASNDNYASIALTIGTNHEAFILNINLDDTQTGFTNNIGTDFAPALNTEYWLKLAFTGSDYQILVSSDGGKTYTLNANLSSTTPFAQNQTAPSCIGIGRALISAQQWGGSIDLNAFKIYVEGDLVYQPCLKIPYTLAADGKKIVGSIYRSRVQDEYNQVGYTPYYTYSSSDYTLATVDNNDIVDSYENGATSYEQRADLSIEQQGSCTADTAVTFPKPFMNTNYALSVPYSAKSATGFTPSVSGDYIAEGYVKI